MLRSVQREREQLKRRPLCSKRRVMRRLKRETFCRPSSSTLRLSLQALHQLSSRLTISLPSEFCLPDRSQFQSCALVWINSMRYAILLYRIPISCFTGYKGRSLNIFVLLLPKGNESGQTNDSFFSHSTHTKTQNNLSLSAAQIQAFSLSLIQENYNI